MPRTNTSSSSSDLRSSARECRPDELEQLTKTVALNNCYSRGTGQGQKVVAFFAPAHPARHYVIKENRTFDQVLGDLDDGSNGDPTLVQFGEAITPSQHRLARQFVTLDKVIWKGMMGDKSYPAPPRAGCARQQ